MAGVLQGDTLTAFLLFDVLNYALCQAVSDKEDKLEFTLTPRRSARIHDKVITDLGFADDICLLYDDIQQAKELRSFVETEYNKAALELNARKTEVMM
jgi:hypothetical protein